MTSDNGNNGTSNRIVVAVLTAIAVAVGTAWATSGTRNSDRIQALEVAQARTSVELDTVKRDIAEIKATLNKIWTRMEKRTEGER
jgi:hypothetical protein